MAECYREQIQCDAYGQLVVQSLKADSAFGGKIQTGDVLVSIDGKALNSLTSVQEACKGKPGTQLRIMLQPHADPQPRTIVAERMVVNGQGVLRPVGVIGQPAANAAQVPVYAAVDTQANHKASTERAADQAGKASSQFTGFQADKDDTIADFSLGLTVRYSCWFQKL